jgi:DNA-binding beta-propeller fold protein YncE
MKQTLFTSILLVCLLTVSAQNRKLTKQWETDSLFKVPESVLYDANNQLLYVSNIDGEPHGPKDGVGSIGRIALDGKILAVHWVKGLNGPKGMGLYKDKLYVTDIDEVVVIDILKATITDRISIKGSKFLNDLSIDNKGWIYVSDSWDGKVYIIKDRKATIYLQNLNGPNGLLTKGDDLYILASGTLYKAGKDQKLKEIAVNIEGGTDGIENVQGKDFIVSSWAGMIYYVNGDGSKQLLLDTRAKQINATDIGYDPKRRIVYVPTFYKNSVVAYQLN